jgi:copper(I)-binding protein
MKPNSLIALIPVAALTLLAGCSNEPATGNDPTVTVAVADVMCRPTPNGRQMTGCYVTLTASADDRLVSVSSPRAGRVEIHESKMENGMMMMTELRQGMPLPAGQTVELQPGGNHIMLLGVAEPMVAGQTVPLTLTFEKAAPVEVQAPVATPPAEASH